MTEDVKLAEKEPAAEPSEAPLGIVPAFSETVQIPDGVEGVRTPDERKTVSSSDDPFPEKEGGAAVIAPAVRPSRGSPALYIFLFFCAILGAVAVAVLGAGIKDAAGRVRITLPSLFYREVVNGGVYEIPRAGEGRIISGKVSVPRIARSGEDGLTPKPGALEPDGQIVSEEEEDDGGGKLPIRTVDISCEEEYGLGMINETGYSPDPTQIVKRERAIPTAAELYAEYGDGAPLVLIVHTHGTESYASEGAVSYSPGDTFRSLEAEDGVVAVGRAVEETLKSRGIGVIHIEEMFDAEDFASAYERSGAAVREALGRFPSVKYVLDVHRDALVTEDGVNLRPLTECDGAPAAQLMTVVGTDGAGADHKGWEDNLALALSLQKTVSEKYPSLMRSVDLRRESFNQQYAPGSLLIEAGAAANSVEEAKRGAAIFAEALADCIIGEDG